MQRTKNILGVLILTIGMLGIWGCPKKTEVSSVPVASEAAPAKSEAVAPAPIREQEAAARTEEERAPAHAPAAGLQPVYFDFDQSNVRGDAQAVLKSNADWLRANPKVNVRIEGNCDERGTREYNQALGQRRAQNTKKYLADLGIPANRITLISYGKEKPACSESAEGCWQRNRRSDVVAAE